MIPKRALLWTGAIALGSALAWISADGGDRRADRHDSAAAGRRDRRVSAGANDVGMRAPPELPPNSPAERCEPSVPSDPTDVNAPDYNAARAYEANRGNMQEIYAQEPRVEPWASDRERDVLEYTRDDVLAVDRDAKLEMDCRTSSCRIRIYSKDPHLVDVLGDYPFACMARYSTADLGQGEAGARYADVYILFGNQNHLTPEFMANRDLTCPKYRTQFFEFIKRPLD